MARSFIELCIRKAVTINTNPPALITQPILDTSITPKKPTVPSLLQATTRGFIYGTVQVESFLYNDPALLAALGLETKAGAQLANPDVTFIRWHSISDAQRAALIAVTNFVLIPVVPASQIDRLGSRYATSMIHSTVINNNIIADIFKTQTFTFSNNIVYKVEANSVKPKHSKKTAPTY